MKKLLFIFLTFLAVNASAQIPYETSVFWQFLEGFQGGDSSTQNYLEYKNNFLLLKTDQRDAKILQARNELNDIGISTIFIDANGNGGFSIDSAGGQTVIKLRGGLFAHSYFLNSHFSIGRGGQTQDYGGNVDGAKFTVSDEREPGYGLWDANNYQMMLQSSKDSIGGYVGLAFTSESATQDRNVGGFINYRKTGNNGRGELHFGTKTTTGSLADGIHAMKIYDGSVTIDSTIVLPNLYTGTSDTSLVISNDTVYKRVAPIIESGTYTPTITDSLNVDATVLYGAHYTRINNIVTVSIMITVDFSAGGSLSIIGLTIPIASDFTNENDVVGSAISGLEENGSNRAGRCVADIGDNKVYLRITHSGSSNYYVAINFTYEIK